MLIESIAAFSPLLKFILVDEPYFSGALTFTILSIAAMNRRLGKKTDILWTTINKHKEDADKRMTGYDKTISGQEKTLKIHGDHFDVLDKRMEDSQQDAHNSKTLCYKMINDLNSVYKSLNGIDPEPASKPSQNDKTPTP